jgi:hypothetical protein
VNLNSIVWTQAYFGIHLSGAGTNKVKIIVPSNHNIFRVLVIDTSFESRFTSRGGYIKHGYGSIHQTIVGGHYLSINEEKLIISKSTEEGFLLFTPANWLYKFSINVESSLFGDSANISSDQLDRIEKKIDDISAYGV